MSENIHFTARQVMDELKVDAVGLWHLMQNDLPAEYCSPTGWRRVEPKEVHRLDPFAGDFEKKIGSLRFLRYHVELWKMGGREALHEGTRMYYPDMGDFPKLTKKALLPCKPGTRWEDVTITTVPSENEDEEPLVRIKTPEGEGLYSYPLLKMHHKQNPSKVKQMWELLKIFAEHGGVISNIQDPRKFYNQKRALDKHLQKLFEINESIYVGHAKRHGYKTRIKFHSEVYRPTIEERRKSVQAVEHVDEDALVEAIDLRRNL